MKSSELKARLNGIPVLRCLDTQPHKSHEYREYENLYCPGVKRKLLKR